MHSKSSVEDELRIYHVNIHKLESNLQQFELRNTWYLIGDTLDINHQHPSKRELDSMRDKA